MTRIIRVMHALHSGVQCTPLFVFAGQVVTVHLVRQWDNSASLDTRFFGKAFRSCRAATSPFASSEPDQTQITKPFIGFSGMKFTTLSTGISLVAIAYHLRNFVPWLDSRGVCPTNGTNGTTIFSALTNEPRQIDIRGVEYPFSYGPKYYALGSYAQQVGVTEAAQLMRHANWYLEEMSATVKALPVMQSIDDYSRVYKSIEDFIDTPISRDQSDAHFGTIRRTINGFNMKLVTADDVQFTQLDFNLTSYQVTSLCGDSLSRLVANNAFFVSDFTDVTKYNDKERPEKYTPSGQGFFCVNYQQDGALLPMAIRLTDTNLMYTPFDHPNEWRLAKMAFNAMEISAQQMQHFVETHLVYEPIRVEMMRAMSPYHPIYNLMDHHLFGVFGIPILARVGLLEDQTTLDSTFGWGAVGCLHYVLNYFQSPTLSLSYSFLDDIKARGVHHIPNHKVVEYGTLLHAELSKFTAAYIDVYYKSDRDVANDRELQNWALWSSQLELVQDFPSELRTKTQLHRLLTHIIFQVSVKHHAMNGQVTWHSISAPFSVPSLWNEPLPTRKGVAIDLSKYIIPDQYLPDLVHVAATFQREIPSRLTLLNAYDAQRFQQHPELQDVLVQFKKNMMTLDTAMAAREAQAAQPYEFLRPSRLPYFGWI